MKSVEIDPFVALLDASDVMYLVQVIHFLLRDAEDASFGHLQKTPLLVNYHTFNLTRVEEDESEEQNANRDSILPPMPTGKFIIRILEV